MHRKLDGNASTSRQSDHCGLSGQGPARSYLRPSGRGHAVAAGHEHLPENQRAERRRVGQQSHRQSRNRESAKKLTLIVVGPGKISRSTVYSRSGFQVMVGATKEVSIVSRSREIDARILGLADGRPTLYRAEAEDHPATNLALRPNPTWGAPRIRVNSLWRKSPPPSCSSAAKPRRMATTPRR
jgi:hypothetical protein